MFKIGQGYDLHTTEKGNHIILGGVKIPAPFKLKAHSDGDVLIHAIIDALLGAIGQGDIGTLFPDTDPKYKNCNSADLLIDTGKLLLKYGYNIVNIDTTIIAQKPKLSIFKQDIAKNLASLLQIDSKDINIKAKTNEGVDAVGQEQAIIAQSIVLIVRAK